MGCFSDLYKTLGGRTKYGALLSSRAMESRASSEQIRSLKVASLWQGGWGGGTTECEKRSSLMRNPGNIEASYGLKGNLLSLWRNIKKMSHQVGNSNDRELQLNRDTFVQLWVSDKKMNELHEKRRRKLGKRKNLDGMSQVDQTPLQRVAQRWFSGGSSVTQKSDPSRQVLQQPPPSQSVSGLLKPESPEEENRYAIVDICYPKNPVGFIREQSNLLARQLLRLRRPFIAYITDAMGNELFRVRRPFWWITSSIYAEINGKEVGVVHRRWHLWRRVYDLYLGNQQFAVVENPGFWYWTFTLKDINGEVLAEIDRDWRGFGFELFTDAGQYVIRFGSSDPFSKRGRAREVQELEVTRSLSLSERAVTLALAISLDNDYFSRHGGWGCPFWVSMNRPLSMWYSETASSSCCIWSQHNRCKMPVQPPFTY